MKRQSKKKIEKDTTENVELLDEKGKENRKGTFPTDIISCVLERT